MSVAIDALSMVLVLSIAKIMLKKVKFLPKGLKGTFFNLKNVQVRYLIFMVPCISFGISHLV